MLVQSLSGGGHQEGAQDEEPGVTQPGRSPKRWSSSPQSWKNRRRNEINVKCMYINKQGLLTSSVAEPQPKAGAGRANINKAGCNTTSGSSGQTAVPAMTFAGPKHVLLTGSAGIEQFFPADCGMLSRDRRELEKSIV
ncbi:unnamed protein product, partial [Amoebophrya sp. A25]|eukprot:GSA25T00009005001.1